MPAVYAVGSTGLRAQSASFTRVLLKRRCSSISTTEDGSLKAFPTAHLAWDRDFRNRSLAMLMGNGRLVLTAERARNEAPVVESGRLECDHQKPSRSAAAPPK